jgi:hypothetical protein
MKSYKSVSLLESNPVFMDLCRWVLPDLKDIVVLYWDSGVYDIDFYFDDDEPYSEGYTGRGYGEFMFGSPTRLKMEAIFDFIDENWKIFDGEQNKEDV